MKMIWKLMLLVLVFAAALPFTYLKGKDGRPLLKISDLKAPDLKMPSLPDLGSLKIPGFGDSGGDSDRNNGISTVYKWQDANGQWTMSNEKPPAGVQYQTTTVNANANVIQSVTVKPPAAAPAPTGEPAAAIPDTRASSYSPQRVEKLVDDAKNVEKLLNDRFERQQKALDDL